MSESYEAAVEVRDAIANLADEVARLSSQVALLSRTIAAAAWLQHARGDCIHHDDRDQTACSLLAAQLSAEARHG